MKKNQNNKKKIQKKYEIKILNMCKTLKKNEKDDKIYNLNFDIKDK